MSVVQKANKLLPQVISMNNQISKHLTVKFKASNIFAELDKRASDNFMEFVNESSDRTQRIKSGNLLQSILSNSIQYWNKKATGIINNSYYSTLLPLTEEENKLKLHSTKFPIQNSLEILNDLKKQNEPIFVSEKIIKEEIKKEEYRYHLSPEILKKNNQIVSNLIEEDKQALNYNLKNYLNKIKSLKEKDPYMMKSRLNSIKMHFNIKMLSYKKSTVSLPKEDSDKIQQETNKKELFDLKYLFKFTKRGIQTEKANSIKKRNSNSNNRYTINSEYKDKRKIPITRTTKRNILNDKTFSNTALLVLKEALKNYSIHEMFDHKKNTLHGLVDFDLPKFVYYDSKIYLFISLIILELIKQKITNEALKKQNKAKIKSKSMDDVKDQLSEKKLRRFAYMSLIEGVKEETVNKEENNQKEYTNKTPDFTKRYRPKFCDGYSLRDGEINRINDNLAKILGNDLSHHDIIEKIIKAYQKAELNKIKLKEQSNQSDQIESKDILERRMRDRKINQYLSKSNSQSEITKNETESILNQEMSMNSVILKQNNYKRRRQSQDRYYHDQDTSLDSFGEFLYFKHLVQNKETKNDSAFYLKD